MDLTPSEDHKRSDEQIRDLRAEVERLTALMRTVDLFGTGFAWTDPRTGAQHVLHPADVVVVLRADQQTEVEKIGDARYQAGREDAAREIHDDLVRVRDRVNEKVSDRKLAACQRVGLEMAAFRVTELSDRWSSGLGRSSQGVGDNPEEQQP